MEKMGLRYRIGIDPKMAHLFLTQKQFDDLAEAMRQHASHGYCDGWTSHNGIRIVECGATGTPVANP